MQELQQSIDNAVKAGVKESDIETEVLKAAYEINRHERRKHEKLSKQELISRAKKDVMAKIPA